VATLSAVDARLPLTEVADLPASFDAVFTGHAAFVWRVLRHLGVAPHDLDDVCQEVFLVVHRKLAAFEGRSSLRTWLYGICRNAARDSLGRAHRRREEPGERAEEATLEGPEGEIDRHRARVLLARILDGLADEQRTVYVLHEIEEVPMAEVAEAMSCPLQTAYYRLHAARQKVLEAAKRLHEEEESR
jgi:RNA polymerase sigma-70 factor, ECF subfamily